MIFDNVNNREAKSKKLFASLLCERGLGGEYGTGDDKDSGW